ncbi:hypothetical protein LSH36_267g03051 [Paralvinella palmiformis]|uniref:Uncharacterized protein n=1 Tax=Paralvinella palmiformis TaxID=53620 RepID=A0AAD9JK69_9ANNE|nr:hypothetical protein LSH36_267g03051 [Paralvinella palmiformis]
MKRLINDRFIVFPFPSPQTFVVISNRAKKKYIYRFSATKALFMLTPWNPLRRFMITIATNQFFDYFIIITILLNMLFMAFHQGYYWLTVAE